MFNLEWLATYFIGLFMTVAILSFVFKDNILFRIAEYVFTGWSVGWVLWTGIERVYTLNLVPVFSGQKPILIIPLFLGLLLFGQFHRKTMFLIRWPTAAMIGATMAVIVSYGIQSNIVRQLKATFAIPIITTNVMTSLSNIIVLLIMAFSMMFFVHSRMGGWTERAPLDRIITFSRYIVLFGIGCFFASAFVGDTIKFIHRIDFIIDALQRLIS